MPSTARLQRLTSGMMTGGATITTDVTLGRLLEWARAALMERTGSALFLSFHFHKRYRELLKLPQLSSLLPEDEASALATIWAVIMWVTDQCDSPEEYVNTLLLKIEGGVHVGESATFHLHPDELTSLLAQATMIPPFSPEESNSTEQLTAAVRAAAALLLTITELQGSPTPPAT